MKIVKPTNVEYFKAHFEFARNDWGKMSREEKTK